MKFRFTFLLPVILLFFSALAPKASTKAQEVDYVAAAVAALQTSNIYVHPGTPGTDFDTINTFTQVLRPQDNVVLVMLPREALVGTDTFAIAKEISQGIGNTKTVGLAAGEDVFGYSLLLPEGVAFDLMQRADDVTTDPAGTLITFSQNVHLWLSRNEIPTPTPTPEPTPTPRPTMEPIELPKVEEIPTPIRAICLSVVVLMLVVILFNVKRATDSLKQQEKKRERKANHNTIEQTITTLSAKVENIKDNKVRKDLVHACELAFGFLEILRHSDYLGYVEEKFPVLLANMNRQVGSFIRHEGGRRPLSPDLYERIRTILLNYDNLFQKMQDNDPSVEELLTSIIDSDTAMVATIGYLEN